MADIPDHNQENLHDQIAASMDILLHAKSKFLPQIVFEILKFKNLSNPTGLEYFNYDSKTTHFTAISFL